LERRTSKARSPDLPLSELNKQSQFVPSAGSLPPLLKCPFAFERGRALSKALAEAVVFAEVPAHVQRTIELCQAAEQARGPDYLLGRTMWTDAEMEQMVRGMAARTREVESTLGSG
jgi:hypothetical protein